MKDPELVKINKKINSIFEELTTLNKRLFSINGGSSFQTIITSQGDQIQELQRAKLRAIDKAVWILRIAVGIILVGIIAAAWTISQHLIY